MIDDAIGELTPVVGVRAACAALGERPGPLTTAGTGRARPRRPERVATPQPRALSEVERKEIRGAQLRRARRRGPGHGLREAPR